MRLDLADAPREAAEQVDYLVALVDAHKFRRSDRGRLQR